MTSSNKRILTALVAVPIVIAVTIVGGWPFVVGVIVVSLLAQWEFYNLVAPNLNVVLRGLGMCAGIAVTAHAMDSSALWTAAILVILVVLLLPLVRPANPAQNLTTILAGVVYPVLPLSFLIDLRMGVGLFYRDVDALVYLTISIFVLLWTTDTAAYFVGKNIGKKPLAPTISPGKTVEGAIGGIVGALIAAAILKYFFLHFLDWSDVVVLGLICGLLSPLGDLAESQLKRSAGVKDSGNLLPGHGGILDRIDALIVAVPLCYFYLRYISL